MHKLIIRQINGLRVGQVSEFEFESGIELRLGRSAASDLVFDSPQDLIVSREHVLLTLAYDKNIGGVKVFLDDLHSSNGTFVEGERIGAGNSISLRSGATIQLGGVGPKMEISWDVVGEVNSKGSNVVGKAQAAHAIHPRRSRKVTNLMGEVPLGRLAPETPKTALLSTKVVVCLIFAASMIIGVLFGARDRLIRYDNGPLNVEMTSTPQ